MFLPANPVPGTLKLVHILYAYMGSSRWPECYGGPRVPGSPLYRTFIKRQKKGKRKRVLLKCSFSLPLFNMLPDPSHSASVPLYHLSSPFIKRQLSPYGNALTITSLKYTLLFGSCPCRAKVPDERCFRRRSGVFSMPSGSV